MSLNYKRLSIPDLIVFEPRVFFDERGFFMEKYKESDYEELALPLFKQDNYSFSTQRVIRGLHYQLPPFEQGKLISVVKGKVWDVAVDMRKESKFFGQWTGVELSDENNLSFYIPPGFAHGFSVLSKEVGFYYKCTAEYSADHDRGVRFDDKKLMIDWRVSNPLVSKKDINLPLWEEAEKFD